MTDKNPIVVMKGITIEFPGVKALDGVDLTLYPGEVHALMGENGAGKSTMIKALTGVYKINAGSIMVDGKPQQFNGTLDAQNAGIATVYQEVNLCTNLSVGENVMLGHEKRGPFGIDWKREQKAVEAEAARGKAEAELNIYNAELAELGESTGSLTAERERITNELSENQMQRLANEKDIGLHEAALEGLQSRTGEAEARARELNAAIEAAKAEQPDDGADDEEPPQIGAADPV